MMNLSQALSTEVHDALRRGAQEHHKQVIKRLNALIKECRDLIRNGTEDLRLSILFADSKRGPIESLASDREDEDFVKWKIFVSPEYILESTFDERSLIYLIGMLGFKFLSGTQEPFVFDRGLPGVFSKGVRDLSEIRPDCPIRLREIIQKATDTNPDQRFQTLADMENSLFDAEREV